MTDTIIFPTPPPPPSHYYITDQGFGCWNNACHCLITGFRIRFDQRNKPITIFIYRCDFIILFLSESECNNPHPDLSVAARRCKFAPDNGGCTMPASEVVAPLGVTTVRLPLPPFFSPSLKLRGIGVLFDLIYPLSPNHLSQFLSPHLISVSLYFYFQLHHPLIPKSLHLQSSWLLSRSLALWWDRWLRGLLDTWWCVTAETEAPLNVISAGLIAVFHARPMQQGTALPPHVQSSAWFWRAYLAFRRRLFEEPTET